MKINKCEKLFNFVVNGNLRILSAMVIVIWINFLETIAFLRVEFSRIWFEKCLEILKIFSKNSNSWYIVIHFRGDSNHFPYETILLTVSRLAVLGYEWYKKNFGSWAISIHCLNTSRTIQPELHLFKIATFSLSFFIYKPNWFKLNFSNQDR